MATEFDPSTRMSNPLKTNANGRVMAEGQDIRVGQAGRGAGWRGEAAYGPSHPAHRLRWGETGFMVQRGVQPNRHQAVA